MSKTYAQHTEENIGTLRPSFAAKVRKWKTKVEEVTGFEVYIYFGYRSPALQDILHQQYLAGGPRAVSARQSYHPAGLACDYYPIEHGQPVDDAKFYGTAAALGPQFGIRGIGDIDNDHMQDAEYPTYEDIPDSFYSNPVHESDGQ